MISSLLQQAVRWKFRAQASKYSSVRHWYKVVRSELIAYGSESQGSDPQHFGQKQESVRIHVCLGNQILIYMRWAYHQDLTSHSDEDLTTMWGWLIEESQYTPQRDKGLWGLTTSMSSIQVPVKLENDPDEPLSPFSPMTAPRVWSKLFLAIRGGCRFLFLCSTTVTSSELLFGRLVQLLSFFLWQ